MRREFPKAVKRQALLRAAGCCEGCGSPLSLGKYQFDHINPDGLTGTPTLENCAVRCCPCHQAKTKQDVAQIARAKRRQDAHLGIRAGPRIQSAGFARAPAQRSASRPLSKPLPPRRTP